MRTAFCAISFCISFFFHSQSLAQDSLNAFQVFSSPDPEALLSVLRSTTADLDIDTEALDGQTAETLDPQSLISALRPPYDYISRRDIASFQETEELLQNLSSAELDLETALPLRLEFFSNTIDNVNIEFIPEQIKTSETGYTTVIGSVPNSPGSRINLSLSDGALTGTVSHQGTFYNLYPLKSGDQNFEQPASGPLTIIDELQDLPSIELEPTSPLNVPDRDQLDVEGNILFPPRSPDAIREPDPTAPQNVPNRNDLDLDLSINPRKFPSEIINLAVYYTEEASQAQGGAMDGMVQSLIDDINFTFERSEIHHSVNLSSSGKVDFDEIGDIVKTRNLLQSKEDGILDDVHALRDETRTDVIGLIVNRGLPVCGIAYIPEEWGKDYSSYAFFVVVRECAQTNLSFLHEFAHILGVRHDFYKDSTQGSPINNNHGMIYRCQDYFCRDISAYPDYCVDVLDIPRSEVRIKCPRERIFGGPSFSESVEISPPEDKDVSSRDAIMTMAPIVAGYR